MSEAAPAAAPRRPGSARRVFATAILVVEAGMVFIAGLVAVRLELAPSSEAWIVAGLLAGVAVAAMATLRSGIGYGIGSVLQIAVVLSGLVVSVMWFLGAVFAVMWIAALIVGGRIDKERIERWEAEHADRLEP